MQHKPDPIWQILFHSSAGDKLPPYGDLYFDQGSVGNVIGAGCAVLTFGCYIISRSNRCIANQIPTRTPNTLQTESAAAADAFACVAFVFFFFFLFVLVFLPVRFFMIRSRESFYLRIAPFTIDQTSRPFI